MRLAIRLALYESSRNDFDCLCDNPACEKHLRLVALDKPEFQELFAEVRGDFAPRIGFLLKHESMVAVGCRFALNDLTPAAWRDLVTMVEERNWMRVRVDDLRHLLREKRSKEDKAAADARRASGLPPPGHSLFPGKAK